MAAIVQENHGSDGGAAKTKKTAVLIYPQFCNFEISTALEILAMGEKPIAEDESILDFIRAFDREDMIIGAISIAPALLLKAGMLKGKPFMAGINKEELAEEGFCMEDMALMTGWDDNLKHPVSEGYIASGNIITSVSCYFVKWALAFGRMLGIEISEKTFGFGF